MRIQSVIALLCLIAVRVAPSAAQVAPNPTHTPDSSAPQESTALFRVTVIGHTTPAVNYRPRSSATLLDFAGTELMPNARGRAKIEGRKGYIEIDANFDKLDAATRFGREYLTYVLWAITPEGRAKNLGELQVNGNDG